MKKTLIAMKMYCFHIQNFQVLLLKVTCYKSNGSQMTAFGDLDKKECGAVQTPQKREYLEMVYKSIKSGIVLSEVGQQENLSCFVAINI